MQLQPYWTYNDVFKLAVKVERQLKDRRGSYSKFVNQDGFSKRGSTSTTKTPSDTNKNAKMNSNLKQEVPNRSSNTRRCFKCQGIGHASDCPNCKIASLVEEDYRDAPSNEEEEVGSEKEVTYADE